MNIKQKMEEKGISIGFLLLPVLCILVGLFLLFLGIKSTVEEARVSARYQVVEGILIDYSLENEEEYDPIRHKQSSATYRLIYEYRVNGQNYTVSTDYSTAALPAIGSAREVLYDPEDPSKAMLNGVTGNTALIFLGLFFGAIPTFMLYLIFRSDKKKKAARIDGVGLAIGLILSLTGWGALCIISGGFSLSGILSFFRTSFTLWLFIPLLMMAVGILQIIRSVFFFRTHAKEVHKNFK